MHPYVQSTAYTVMCTTSKKTKVMFKALTNKHDKRERMWMHDSRVGGEDM